MTTRITISILLAAVLLATPACRKKASESGAAEGSAPPGGHEHGHGNEEHADEVRLTAESVERYGIRVEAAQNWVLRPTIVVPARVAFNAEALAHVGSPLRGRIAELPVRIGQEVSKGDALAVIESPELGEAQTELLQRRVARESAGPAVDLARGAWERGKGLYERSQGLSLTEVERREAEYKAALAAQRAAESAVAAAENRLRLLGMTPEAIDALAKTGRVDPRSTIRASIAGRVVQREATLGELVGPERENLMVLADMATVWVLAEVPEAKLADIAVGGQAWVHVGTSDARPFEATVAFISPMVDAGTRTAEVRIEVPTKGGTLKPGMFASVEIVAAGGSDPSPMIAVPDTAIQTVEGGPAVFVPVEGEPNTFAKRAVTVGRSVGGMVPVYAGLVEGEKFVSAGSFILKADLGKAGAAHEH